MAADVGTRGSGEFTDARHFHDHRCENWIHRYFASLRVGVRKSLDAGTFDKLAFKYILGFP